MTADAHVSLIVSLSPQPGRQTELVELLRENTETVIMGLKGWVSTRMIASDDGAGVVIVSQWESAEDVAAMKADPRMTAYFPRIAELASLETSLGATVLAHHR